MESDGEIGVFGDVIIGSSNNNMIYIWEIKVIKIRDTTFGMEIGIADKNKYSLLDSDSGNHYLYACDGTVCNLVDLSDEDEPEVFSSWYQYFNEGFKNGDVVKSNIEFWC